MKYDKEIIEAVDKINRVCKRSSNIAGTILLGDDGMGKYVVSVIPKIAGEVTRIGGTRNETEGLLSGIMVGMMLMGAPL